MSSPAVSFSKTEALPHLDTLYRVALRLTGDQPAAEDLVQDTMLRALRALEVLPPGIECARLAGNDTAEPVHQWLAFAKAVPVGHRHG